MMYLWFIKFWAFNVLVALDQLVNAILFGYCDETLSSRCHRMAIRGHWLWPLKYLVNVIFWWQEDHCKEAYESERQDRHLPPEMRNKRDF